MNPAGAPSTFGFGFGASVPPASTGASGFGLPAAPTPTPAPAADPTALASASAPTATPTPTPVAADLPAAPSAVPAAPAPPKKTVKKAPAPPLPVLDLMAKLRLADSEGCLNADLRQDLKTRFAAPFSPPQASAAPMAGTAPTAMPMATGVGATAASVGARLHQFSQLSSEQEKNQTSANAQNVRTATEFLNVLLMCDSGFNNIEVPVDADDESVKGLHAAIGELAPTAAANIITYLTRELLPTAGAPLASAAAAAPLSAHESASAVSGGGLTARIAQHTVVSGTAPPVQDLQRVFDGSTTNGAGSSAGASSLSASARGGLLVANSPAKSNPILLSAQCLYLLTRHFQMQASLVKSLVELVHQLLRQLRVELQGRPMEFSRFRASTETSSLCTLLWFVIFSVVNVMAVWKKLRGPDGRLEINALLRTAVADTLDDAITAMRREFEQQASHIADRDGDSHTVGGLQGAHNFLSSSAGSGPVTGGLLGRVSASRRADAQPQRVPGADAGPLTVDGKVVGGYGQFNRRWEVVVQAYLSILTLAEACFLRGKQDDASYEKACDKAVEAFLGDRESNATSMCRGKAVKRMHQLMPHPSTVFVPLEILYVAPYEVLSYLFDYMVQFLRRISELEVASFARYLRQAAALEERFAASAPPSTRGSSNPGGTSTQHAGFASRHHHYGQALRAMLPEARNYAMDGVAEHSGVAAQLLPFTSEMSHMLETLSACLQHLPPEVLNPDLDSDCAATFFILENFTKHLSLVLKLQRSSASLWESFTLKTVARYLDVLTMIGRNPQYIERVVKLLSSTQAECPELEWSGLVNQALACTGLARHGAAASPVSSGGGSGGLATSNVAAALPDVEEEGAMHQPYRQYLPAFARKCQQSYVASFFMLMRQMFLHPELRDLVLQYFTLELGLAMLHAENHSQSTLGSTLSLLSALISNADEAQRALQHLCTEHFLAPWTGVSMGVHSSHSSNGQSGAQGQDLFSGPAGADRYAARPSRAQDTTQHVEARSLLGHCEYEATVGRYSITVGFLNLLIALLRYDMPGMESFEIYTSVIHFVAHKIFIGVARRTFEKESERGTVTALAAAALRHALLLCFTADSTVNTIPFQTVMATVKAPSDVLGELLGVVLKASARTAELSVYECAAVRQCLRLLSTAIHAPSRQLQNDFCFDARALNSAMLPFRMLLLCGGRDSLLTHAVLRVLTSLPSATMTEASHMWYAHAPYFAAALANFADTLNPKQFSVPLTYAPPELIVLDYDWGPQGSLKSLSPVAVLEENRSALLDLLIQHAPIREPSTAAWLCGFYTLVMAAPATPSTMGDPAILAAVMSGAQSADMAEAYPLLAVKYTRLLYELRANTLYGASAVRPLMEHYRCHSLFLELQYLRPDRCHPLLLSKYAYVLKMLSLEVVFTHSRAPEQLDVAHRGIPSVAVEVVLSLLERSGSEAEELSVPVGLSVDADFPSDLHASTSAASITGASARKSGPGDGGGSGLSSRAATVDIADWLRQAFTRLPSFPECRPPPSAKDLYVMRAADGVVQFNIDTVFNAVQQENIRLHRVPLSLHEARDALQPYVEANYCFLLYACAVNLVEAWCELVGLSFCVVRGLPDGRLRAFVQHILSGVAASMAMTRAAQEQVAFRLFSCLSTLMVQLRKQVEQQASRAWQQHGGPHGSTGAAACSGSASAGSLITTHTRNPMVRNSVLGATGVVDMSGSRANQSSAAMRGQGALSTRRVAGQRRARDVANTSVFSTAASTHYSTLSASARAALVSQQHDAQHRHERRDRLERLGAWTFDDTRAAIGEANQCLVGPLVSAVVEWGTRVSGVRVDLYMSLLCLSLIPGVTVEEMMLRRQQDALFTLLASDIAGSTVDHTRRRAALELLIQLLQTSPTLRAGFVTPTGTSALHGGLSPALSSTAEQCAQALLTLVDNGVHGFLTTGGEALGELLWLIRGTFDFLCVLSQDNASSLLGSTVFDLCLSLRSWTQSSQVVLGHTAESDLLQPSTAPLEANKEVLMRLLLGSVRWFNLLLSEAAESPRLQKALQQFVRVYRHLIEYALNAPLAHAHVRPLTTVSMTLYAEITSMLEWLSTSSLVEECRVLVPALALTRLLGSMANEQFLDGPWFTGEYAASTASLVETSRYQAHAAGGAGPASAKQRDLGLLTVRNIAHLLLRTELGAASMKVLPPSATVPQTTALLHRPLRAQPTEMASIAHSLRSLAELTMRVAHNATTSVTLESLLLALHALVCLCHSFVLPASEGGEYESEDTSGASHEGERVVGHSPPAATSVGSRSSPMSSSARVPFIVYLRTVPLATLLETLRRVQEAVYALQALNADYRTGVHSHQTPRGFAITTDSLSNQLTAHAGDRLTSIVAPQSTTGRLTEDAHRSGSHPTTPLTAPAGTARRHSTPGTPHLSLDGGRGGTSRLLASAAAPTPATGDAARSRKSAHFADESGEALQRHVQHEHTATFLDEDHAHTARDAAEGATIGDLLDRTTPDTTTATSYVGFPSSARDGASMTTDEDPDDFVYAGAADWGVILGLEHTARQLKIGIANAIAATEDATKRLEQTEKGV